MSDTTNRPLSIVEATEPVAGDSTDEVKAWQDAKVRAAIRAADAGEFATPDELRAIIRKYVPHG